MATFEKLTLTMATDLGGHEVDVRPQHLSGEVEVWFGSDFVTLDKSRWAQICEAVLLAFRDAEDEE